MLFRSSLAPTRAGVNYGQAQNIYPDYRRAQTFNTIGDLASLFTLYKGLGA